MKKENLFLFIMFAALLAACTVSVQVIKDSDNNTVTHSNSTTNSADSASVDLKVK